jgi:hypothetical protein
MKFKLLISTLFLVNLSYSFGQTSKWEVFQETDNTTVIVNAINYDSLDNKTLLIYIETDTSWISKFTISHLKIVDKNGQLLREKKLKIDSLVVNQLYAGFFDKYKKEFNLFGSAAELKGVGRSYFTHYRLDENLNVLSTNIKRLADYWPILHLECSETLDSGYICSAVQSNNFRELGVSMVQNIMKVKADNIENKWQFVESPFQQAFWNVLQNPKDKKYYGIGGGGLNSIDDVFKKSKRISGFITPSSNLTDFKIFNSQFLISGIAANVLEEVKNFAFFFGYIGDDYKISKANGIGQVTVTSPLINQQIDFKFSNKLFASDHEQTDFQLGPYRFFNLGLFDENLDKIWEIKYGLNTGRRYNSIGITATYDGGVIVYGGLLSKFIDGKSHYDPFYIKFDCNGSVVATENIDKEEIFSIKQYPNPAINELKIELSGFQFPLTMKVFDNSGKLVEQKIVPSQNVDLDISDYAKGMYNYTLSNEKLQIMGSKTFVKM